MTRQLEKLLVIYCDDCSSVVIRRTDNTDVPPGWVNIKGEDVCSTCSSARKRDRELQRFRRKHKKVKLGDF